MARVTRAESQARTRAQLISTATEMFLRDGFAATSLEKVSEAAGFTRGAVYSNFRNKEELCLVVLNEYRLAKFGEIVESLQADSVEEQLAGFGRWAERMVGDVAWTRLELEFAAHASRDEELSPALRTQLNLLVDIAEDTFANVGDSERAGSLDEHEVAVAVLSLGIGLGILRAIEPALPIAALTKTLRTLLGQDPPAQSHKWAKPAVDTSQSD